MALLGGLIHNFTICETRTTQKFTSYKICMISFPRNNNLFGSLCKISVWKRYSDVKALETELTKTYKSYNLKTFFKSDNAFFKRFDPAVIEQRKKSILEFLYYCAENPVIYRSQCFVKFFENGSSSPVEDAVSTEIDRTSEDAINSSIDDSVDFQSQNNSIELDDDEEPESQSIQVDENSFEDLSTGFDYLYDAAMSFSHAVQQEANNNYKQAFELYKNGIDKLLTGAKNDKNEKRKSIAKTKAGKYLERAEVLYENHIMQLQEESFVFEDQTVVDAPSVLALERPVNNLSRFKVIAINNYLMRVQDCTDKKFYILKNVYKDTNSTICLPQAIPFMTRLVSYYKTENSIFLLFPLVSGGLLWDYVNSYSNKCETKDFEEIFVDPPKEVEENCEDFEEIEENFDENRENLDIEVAEESIVDDFITDTVTIPSFDTLSTEMDINDLMSCSLNLLQSVSKTLEKSQVKSEEKKENFFDEEKNEKVEENSENFEEFSLFSDRKDELLGEKLGKSENVQDFPSFAEEKLRNVKENSENLEKFENFLSLPKRNAQNITKNFENSENSQGLSSFSSEKDQKTKKNLEKSENSREILSLSNEKDQKNKKSENSENFQSNQMLSKVPQYLPNNIAQIHESVLKQWASELVISVNSLHKAGIICGDLNLDNLLLGPNGHLTLTYFYQNDRNDIQQLCRLNQKAMKCLYVAFEFPLTKFSDWYSVGILIYELMTRERFYLNHPIGIFRFNEIQYSNPEALSEDCMNLLHGLIIEKPENRLKFEDIICHPFFKGTDWNEVEKCGLDLFKM